MSWHRRSVSEIVESWKTNIHTGLSSEDAAARLKKYGANEMTDAPRASIPVIFLLQMKNPLLIILMVGAALSLYGDHLVDAIAIFSLVIINALISTVQEVKARSSLDALKEMGSPETLALRDREWKRIPATDVVPGDVLRLNTGDVVAADMRLIEAHTLEVNESALTGESEPVEKHIERLDKEGLGVGDRTNMVFMSSAVTAGNGIGIVCATGMRSEVGHIAALMQEAEQVKSPMQRRLDTLSHILIAAALSAVTVVVGIGLHHGADWMEMVQTGISLCVAAIPEGLPTVVTIVMTMGARRMAQQHALVRQLASVETLGSTTVICSDKTGTLTRNQMQVVSLWSGGKTWTVSGAGFSPYGEFLDADGNATDPNEAADLKHTLVISAICNDAILKENDGQYQIEGNPTEGSLVVAAAKAGIKKDELLGDGFEIVRVFPFDSKRKMASVIIRDPKEKYYLVAKGAPDVLLKRSAKVHWGGNDLTMDDALYAQVASTIETFGGRALRTLAVAFSPLKDDELDRAQEEHEDDLTMLAIHGIIDPPRSEVIPAVEQCHDAGIRTIMITGDHAATATAIAEEIGIKEEDDELTMTGPQLEEMSDRKLKKEVPHVAVFARVSPEHKQRIVKALQANGEVAAMTGDGVNDAPALKNADIGVAMGIAGTQVAKDASDLILLDDNFASIVSAVREGRRIYDNIRKFLREQLTANVAEVTCVLFAFLLMGRDPIVPLTALMILWINMVSDLLPSLALGMEREEPDIMTRPRLGLKEGLFSDHLGTRILVRGLVHGWVTYQMFDYAIKRGAEVAYAQTLAFVVLVMVQVFHVFDARTFTSIYRRNPFENKYLLWSLALAVALTLLGVYLPIGNLVLGTVPIRTTHLIMAIAISAVPTFVLSGIKEIFKVKWL